ncbi:MAG: tetratricopeptide repeat protein, partial [Chloroflexota bacterium]
AAATLVGLAVLGLAASRTAYAATVVVILVLLAWRWRRAGLVVALLAMMAAGLALWHYGWLEPVQEAAADGAEAALDSLPLSARPAIWWHAYYMVRDHPFTGIGLNTFDAVLDGFYPVGGLSLSGKFTHAHNIFLQTALDLGLPGLIGFLGLCLGTAYVGWRSALGRAAANVLSPARRAAVVGLLAGLLAYLLFGLTDAIALGAKPTVLLWLMLGLVVAAGEGTAAPARPRLPARAYLGIAAGLVLVAVLTLNLWLSALYVNLGRIDLARADYAGALAYAEDAVGRDDANPRAHLLLGLARLGQGEAATALAPLERAVALDPANASAHYHLAEVYERLGREEEAVAHWQAAEAGSVLRDRGAAARKEKDLPAAERWYALAVRVDPANLGAWLALGQVQQDEQRWAEAAATYTEVVDRFPASLYGYNGLANVLYYRLDEKDRAREVLDQGVAGASDPKPQLYYLRSAFRADAGDWPGAEADARQAIDLVPTNGYYLARLGDLYSRQKRYDEALAQYDPIPARASDPAWAWLSRQRKGSVYVAQQDWPAAIAEYAAAVDESIRLQAKPNVVAGNYVQLGIYLQRAKRPDEAAAAYRAALAQDPTNQDAAKRLQEIEKK